MKKRSYGHYGRGNENTTLCVEQVYPRDSYQGKQCGRKRRHGNFCKTHLNKFLEYRKRLLVQSDSWHTDRFEIDNALSVNLPVVFSAESGAYIQAEVCGECRGILNAPYDIRENVRCTCHDVHIKNSEAKTQLEEVAAWDGLVAYTAFLNRGTHVTPEIETARFALNALSAVTGTANAEQLEALTVTQKGLLLQVFEHAKPERRRWY